MDVVTTSDCSLIDPFLHALPLLQGLCSQAAPASGPVDSSLGTSPGYPLAVDRPKTGPHNSRWSTRLGRRRRVGCRGTACGPVTGLEWGPRGRGSWGSLGEGSCGKGALPGTAPCRPGRARLPPSPPSPPPPPPPLPARPPPLLPRGALRPAQAGPQRPWRARGGMLPRAGLLSQPRPGAVRVAAAGAVRAPLPPVARRAAGLCVLRPAQPRGRRTRSPPCCLRPGSDQGTGVDQPSSKDGAGEVDGRSLCSAA